MSTLSIVSHGHGALVRALLDDLSAQQGIEQHQVLLTLNVPEPEFAPGDWPKLDLRILRNAQPKGFGANHNAAFAHHRGDWYLVVNPDIRLPRPDILQSLLRNAPTPHSGLLAPRVLNEHGETEDSVRGPLSLPSLLQRAWRRRRGQAMPAPDPQRARFFWLAGMFLVFDPSAFREIGGFDERFFLYCEDYDICARLHLAGRSLTLRHDVAVVHQAQRDSHRRWRHLRMHLSSVMKVWLSGAFWRLTLQGYRAGSR